MTHRLGFWRSCQTRQGIGNYKDPKKDYLLAWFPDLSELARSLPGILGRYFMTTSPFT